MMTTDARKRASEDLLEMMRFVSESMWSAGWRSGLEFLCWSECIGDAHPSYKLSKFNWPLMLQLACKAQGWWCWSWKLKRAVFVSLGFWLKVSSIGHSPQAEELIDREAEILSFDDEGKA